MDDLLFQALAPTPARCPFKWLRNMGVWAKKGAHWGNKNKRFGSNDEGLKMVEELEFEKHGNSTGKPAALTGKQVHISTDGSTLWGLNTA